jgi:peptidoglycan-N-acetylglucosamine deacetylase
MKFYWIKTNWAVKKLFKNYIWDIPNKDKIVYLTFDDGPTPKITEWTLAQLKNYNAKATFFCIGNNIEKHPDIFNKIIKENHSIGNHTFNHLKGWETTNEIYIENTLQCDSEFIKNNYVNCKLFRPPYGRIKKQQATALKNLGYKIIMWDVLSADFDPFITPQKCLENVLSNVKSGSIIVFHDSEKAFRNLEFVLPKSLAFLKENGFRFEAIY